jgi:hypothetical protein
MMPKEAYEYHYRTKESDVEEEDPVWDHNEDVACAEDWKKKNIDSPAMEVYRKQQWSDDSDDDDAVDESVVGNKHVVEKKRKC